MKAVVNYLRLVIDTGPVVQEHAVVWAGYSIWDNPHK